MTPDGPLPGDDSCVSCQHYDPPDDEWAGRCYREGMSDVRDTYAGDTCEHHELDPDWGEAEDRVHGAIIRQAKREGRL